MAGQSMREGVADTAALSEAQKFADTLPEVSGSNQVPVRQSPLDTQLHGPELATNEEMGRGVKDYEVGDPTPATRGDLAQNRDENVKYGLERDAKLESGKKRDKLQERVGLGAMGLMHMSGRAQQQQAELETEQQRMMQERGTQDANTSGGQVAVTA
jgi:hypothetical protein